MKIVENKEQTVLQKKLDTAFNILNPLDHYIVLNENFLLTMDGILLDSCFAFYEHPVHKYKNKTYQSSKHDLIAFLKDKICPEKGEGIDLIITDYKFIHFFIFNHDGDVFYYNSSPMSKVYNFRRI